MKDQTYLVLALSLFILFAISCENSINQKKEALMEKESQLDSLDKTKSAVLIKKDSLLKAKRELTLKMDSNEIHLMLNKWHNAAATANADSFFGFMTEDCIYLGTDPSEKWKRDELREWASFAFERDTAWAFTPFEREIYFSENGNMAWFDEKLKTQMGECRGSGVLIRSDNGWKLKHYNLAVTILNEKMDAFLEIEQ